MNQRHFVRIDGVQRERCKFVLLTAKYGGEAEKRVQWTVFSILARTVFEARVAGSNPAWGATSIGL